MLTTESALRKDRTTGYTKLEHRHFATIAAIIAEMRDGERRQAAEHFADRLHETNPNFDAARFLRACNV